MSNKKVTINEYNILGAFLQLIVTVVALIFLIIGLLLNKKYFMFFEISIIVDLLLMAYNNKRIYKRKRMTTIYIVGSIIMALYVLMTVLGVE